jgi:hypothetical protein
LEAVRREDTGVVGAKALGLSRLHNLGLHVPSGFCVTAAAYTEHLGSGQIMPKLEAALDKLKEAGHESKRDILSGIRRAIVKVPAANRLREEIARRYDALGSGRLAVRSSATAEDLPGHSFAGLHDTYLGIGSIEECMEAVKKCWASLWTRRAYEYRQKNSFDHVKVNMAVIVQSLIPADASGVLFTADPRIGPSGNIVIEACFGLGQTLVSGRLTPDRFVVHRKTLRLLFSTVSEKKIECVLDSSGTVKEQEVPSERSISESLDNKQIKRLAKLARKVEAEFGCPRDIEWAVSQNKVYLLQSRPITGLTQERSWEDRQIWSNNPAKEVMPDVVTPIMFSMLLETIGEEFFDPIFRMLCCDRGDHPLYSLIAGRIYFNANIWGAVFRQVPGDWGLDLMEMAGGHKGIQEMVERLQTAPDRDLPDIKFSLLRFILKMPLTIIGLLLNTPKKGRRIISWISAENEKWSDLNVSNLSAEQITTSFQQLRTDLRRLLSHMLYLFSILSAFPLLHLVCAKWLADDGSCANRLLAGVGDMDDAVAGLDRCCPRT